MTEISGLFQRLHMLQDWELCEEVGHGGHGTVYRVRSKVNEEYAALKWIHIEREEDHLGQDRFLESQRQILNEIATLRMLSDIPQIAGVQDYSVNVSEDGSSWDVLIRMEFLTPLLKLLTKGTFTTEEALKMSIDLATALETCHSRGVIHGDIKPGNILKGNCYKLGDFGIATVLNDICVSHSLAGTRAYQPPEYIGVGHPTRQGDIYSLGMTLYQVFNNGLLPFQNGFSQDEQRNALEQRKKLSESEDRQRYSLPRYAPEAIGQVICRACAPNPEGRFQTAKDFSVALHGASAELNVAQRGVILPYLNTSSTLAVNGVLLSTDHQTEDLFVQISGCQAEKMKPNILNPEDAEETTSHSKHDSEQLIERNQQNTSNGAVNDFVKPTGEQSRKSLPAEPEPAPTPQEEPQQGRHTSFKKQWILISSVVALIALTVFLFLGLPGSRTLDVEVKAKAFSADIVSDGDIGSLWISPAAQPNAAREIKLDASTQFIDGLIPQTEYCLMTNKASMVFKTASADEEMWINKQMVLYTAPRDVVMDIEKVNAEIYPYLQEKGNAVNETLKMPDQPHQSFNCYLYCVARYMGTDFIKEMPIVTVLRLADGEIYSISGSVILEKPESSYFLVGINNLLERSRQERGSQYYGKAELEMYVNGGKAGTFHFTISDPNNAEE